MKRQWSACTVVAPVVGEENGYPFAFWVMRCPFNPASGQPEVTHFKSIKGNDGFYIIQKAFKFDPSKEQAETWVKYLHKIKVCDMRPNDRICPDFLK